MAVLECILWLYWEADDAEGRADGDSGAPLLASLAGAALSAEGRADGDYSGALVVRATLAGAAQSAGARFVRACGGEHSSVRARFQFLLVLVQALLPAAWGFSA